jgi:hypothetical protein
VLVQLSTPDGDTRARSGFGDVDAQTPDSMKPEEGVTAPTTDPTTDLVEHALCGTA